MRVFATSDIHIDYRENWEWIKQLSSQDYRDDILILAGDVTDKLDLLETCFHILSEKFSKIAFIPGNHDLWIRRNPDMSSLEKLGAISQMIEQWDNISMSPIEEQEIRIVPLFSWYDFSFGEPGEDLLERWMDFRLCQWPEGKDENWVSEHFLGLNTDRLSTSPKKTISFSHFLPRIDVMPNLIPQRHRFIYPVLGSSAIDEQVRILDSDIHVYGHSHVNRDTKIDGIRYINNAFGYPKETRIARKRLKLIWNTGA